MKIQELKKFQGLNPAVDFLLGKLDGPNREAALIEMVFHLGTQLQMRESAKPIKLPPEQKGVSNQSTVSLQSDPMIFISPERDMKPSEPEPKVQDIQPKVLPIEGKSDRMRKLDEGWEPEQSTSKKKRGWRW